MSAVKESTGTYQQFLESLIEQGYPNLRSLNEHVFKATSQSKASCTVLSFSQDGDLQSSRLAQPFDFEPSHTGNSRRLFIMEGMSSTLVEQLGSLLDIEPEFFNSHLRSTIWEKAVDRSNSPMLPSVRSNSRFWTVQYFENICLESSDLAHIELGSPRLHGIDPLFRRIYLRKYKVRNPYERYVGLVNRMLSLWQKRYANGCFDVVILVDPPLDTMCTFGYESATNKRSFSSVWRPFGDGFVDFANLSHRKAFQAVAPKFPRSRNGSIADMLAWRLQHPSLFGDTSDTLQVISMLAQKITLHNWTLTIAILQRDHYMIDLKSLTDSGTDNFEVRQTLGALQSSRNLLDRCSLLARRNLIQLGLQDATLKPPATGDDLERIAHDWMFVRDEIQTWIADTERKLNIRMLSLDVLDSKRASENARRGEIMLVESAMMTKLGQFLVVIYTPTSIAYGVLSMADDFAFGKKNAWVFFAIAVPLSLLTFVIYYSWMRLPRLRAKRMKEDQYPETIAGF